MSQERSANEFCTSSPSVQVSSSLDRVHLPSSEDLTLLSSEAELTSPGATLPSPGVTLTSPRPSEISRLVSLLVHGGGMAVHVDHTAEDALEDAWGQVQIRARGTEKARAKPGLCNVNARDPCVFGSQ